jgi:hypothetical protein
MMTGAGVLVADTIAVAGAVAPRSSCGLATTPDRR